MMLWMAYGLAEKERRPFFIDDSRWAYGKFTGMFKEPPTNECRPPPRHEMLPCPRHARHLIVSAATARDTFGNSFTAEYERPRRTDVGRERPMYDLARTGYEALFHLNDDDQPYVDHRIKELKSRAKVPESKTHGTIVGVHVRHGDLHPYEYQYNGAYIPLNVYAERARELLEGRHNASRSAAEAAAGRRSFVVVASDDPLVYESEEFAGAQRAQEQIKLASKPETPRTAPNRHVMHKFVDETFGWEGGFFATMFWNLGRPSHNNAKAAADAPQQQQQQQQQHQQKTMTATTTTTTTSSLEPSVETIRLRGLIGRAYVMDLAVLGEASDAVVCAISAMACRLVAVIMGWERAMAEKRWVNVDDNFQWTALSL